uniref:Uncharacterized protein n=1 Tax=Globisporangium ultimum (strain ATCC 200006 / CBS 805.95 / DAOM BR144) TaxID=431595 RepID=K3WZK8_GLOUD
MSTLMSYLVLMKNRIIGREDGRHAASSIGIITQRRKQLIDFKNA